jgi:hypothetical protein
MRLLQGVVSSLGRPTALGLLPMLVGLAGCTGDGRSGSPPDQRPAEEASAAAAAPADASAADAATPDDGDANHAAESGLTEETAPPETEGAADPSPEAGTASVPPSQPALPPEPEFPEEVPEFERPEHVRGIYLNAWASGSRRKVRNLLAMVEGTEVNAFVIDLKDATGFVSHPSSVPLVAEIGADEDRRIGNLHSLLWRLKEGGVYPIARIVIMKDPRLSDAFPDLAVQDTAGGPWVDGKGQVWLNPYSVKVWDYHIALAREAAEAGFPEIQWDYVRFPDAPKSEIERTTYPGAEGRTRAEAIRAFLAYSRAELADLNVPVTADVFGVTTSASGDVGIGQVWERFIDMVDVALPMVYPSHYWKGSFGFDRPNAYPYEIVYEALIRAQNRTAAVEGAGIVRPWLQDFTLGKPRYEAGHVRAQIQATYDAGVQEWILWNPGSRYTSAAIAPAQGWAEGQEPLIPVADTMVVAAAARQYLQDLREAEAAAKAAAEAEAAAEAARAREAQPADGADEETPEAPADAAADTVPGGSR